MNRPLEMSEAEAVLELMGACVGIHHHSISEAWAARKVVGGVCHGPLGLLLAKDETGEPLVKGRRLTAVTDKQVEQLGITMTPQHPERELRAAGALFESETALQDMFANHVVVDGRLVTGQNQNACSETILQRITIGRAFTCCQPVMPGWALSRPRCQALYCSTS